MSRLNYMSDIELAILTIQEELDCLERHVTSGGRFDEYDARALLDCLQRLAVIVAASDKPKSSDWETSEEPLPPWLQRREDDKEAAAAEPVPKKA